MANVTKNLTTCVPVYLYAREYVFRAIAHTYYEYYPALNKANRVDLGQCLGCCNYYNSIAGYIMYYYNTYRDTFHNNTNIQYVSNFNQKYCVDMYRTFEGANSLIGVSDLPKYVSNMSYCFDGCTNLTDLPNRLPDGKYSMVGTFRSCTNLVNIPVIPNSVTDMSYTFRNCTNLVNTPVIPNSVTNMGSTFYGCTNLVNAPEIPNGVTNMYYTFGNCTNLVNAPVIPNSVINMYGTFSSCNNLVNAPVIPNSVTDMFYTFANCTNLINAPEIPNSVTNMHETFTNCNIRDVYIHAPNVISGATFGYSTVSHVINVYIPFTYENGVNTQTYNLFSNYKTNTWGDNLKLYDTGTH